LSTIGEEVTLSFGENPDETVLVGLAESINDDGGLIIRKADGSLFTANAGEVTLAKKGRIL
jgi:biotin-(acetyl-CoA carboxylase) ligase